MQNTVVNLFIDAEPGFLIGPCFVRKQRGGLMCVIVPPHNTTAKVAD